MTPSTVKNRNFQRRFKVFNFLWYKVLSTQIKNCEHEHFEKKMRFFLMSQGSLNPKIKFLGQKVCPVSRPQTHTNTKVNTEGTLSVFQEFSLQPIIKDRTNYGEMFEFLHKYF